MVAASEKQIAFAKKLGITNPPNDKFALSKMIDEKLKQQQPRDLSDRFGFSEIEKDAANQKIDLHLNSILYTYNRVNTKLNAYGIRMNPAQVLEIVRQIREEVNRRQV